MLTAPEIMAGGVTGASIGVTGANTDVTDASVDGATGAVGPTDVAGVNSVPWAADVARGTVVPLGLDVELLAITAVVADGTGVARTGM